jgi:hypothetical protein
MNRRHLALLPALTLAGCATPKPEDYAAERPLLDLKTYFNGTAGRPRHLHRPLGQGGAALHGADDGHLARQPGRARRALHLQRRQDRAPRLAPHRRRQRPLERPRRRRGGRGRGPRRGNALNWRYTLRLPVDGKVYEVQFDDWMYLIDERVMLNKAEMSKFGVRLGEVTLAFTP